MTTVKEYSTDGRELSEEEQEEQQRIADELRRETEQEGKA
jgi:hypothetical protein